MSVRLVTSVAGLLLLVAVMVVNGNPRFVRATIDDSDDPSYVTVTTKYGGLRGRTYNISDSMDLDIFLGVPYAKPPVGDLRLARPEPVSVWSPVIRNATQHGAICEQRIIRSDPELPGVPYSEDCLFLDIYTTRQADDRRPKPVMIYYHPGGYYGGSGAKYNFTNLALKGVVVVSVSFRLDALGFLSTQDEVIPGNFGVLDAALALSFIKEIIGDFGGNPDDVTLFGASSGAAMVSIFSISPLTRGMFQKAIMQSGSALSPWAVFTPGRKVNIPREVALGLGRRLNCSLPVNGSDELQTSRDLLTCLRAVPVVDLIRESVALQLQQYQGQMVFIPVSGDSFDVLPKTPAQLMEDEKSLIPVPTLTGYTSQDGSWLVPDPEGDGVSKFLFPIALNTLIRSYYRPERWESLTEEVMAAYLPDGLSQLSDIQIRDVMVKMATDASMASPAVKQARLFSRAGTHENSVSRTGGGAAAKTFVYEFNYRPSYSTNPAWYGVAHADEKGFVLGLPPGPDPFNYPNTTADDRKVADLITTMWTNFAKYADPTPQALDGLKWPEFGHVLDDQQILLIRPELGVKKFQGNEAVEAWTGSSGLVTSGAGRQAQVGGKVLILLTVCLPLLRTLIY